MKENIFYHSSYDHSSKPLQIPLGTVSEGSPPRYSFQIICPPTYQSNVACSEFHTPQYDIRPHLPELWDPVYSQNMLIEVW